MQRPGVPIYAETPGRVWARPIRKEITMSIRRDKDLLFVRKRGCLQAPGRRSRALALLERKLPFGPHEERQSRLDRKAIGDSLRSASFLLACLLSGRLHAANPTGEGQVCSPAVPGAKVIYCQPTESGPLAVTEVDVGTLVGCRYIMALGSSVVMKTDCESGAPGNLNSEFPIINPLLLDRRSLDFDEVVVLEQDMAGNACGRGPLRFLGINGPNSPVKYVLSDAIDRCDGPAPVFTLEPRRIRVTWPGDPEAWVYEGGQVHKETAITSARPAPPRLGAPLGKTVEGEINWEALKWWAGEYPIDLDTPERDFFKVPEVYRELTNLLGVAGYERLRRDFGLMESGDVIQGCLVLKGSTNPHTTGEDERAAVAVQLYTGKFSVLFSPERGQPELLNGGGVPGEVLKSLPKHF
jgi:hypothetical protein